MLIYVLEIAAIWFFNVLCFHSTYGKDKKKLFLFLSISMMVLVLGLRSNSVGEDTNHYVDIFNRSSDVSWNEIFASRFKTVLHIDQFGYADKMENGFLIFTKIVHLVTSNPQVYLIIMAAITMGYLAKFIYDNSKNVFFSTYVLMCESIYMFTFNGSRQSMALAIGVNAYTLIKNKKFKSAIATILLASYIHNSALILFMLLPIMLIKPNAEEKSYRAFKYVLVGAISLPFLLPFAKILVSQILPKYVGYFVNNYWEASIGGTAILWFIEIVLILYMYSRKFEIANTYEYSSLTLIYLIFDMIGLLFTGIGRLAMYFRIFLVLFYPKAIDSISSRKYRKIILCLIYILLTLAFLSYARQEARLYNFFLQ